MGHADAVVLRQFHVEQTQCIVAILALVLQRAVEGEQQTTVVILTIRRIINMVTNLLLGQRTAPDHEVVEQALAGRRALATQDNRVVALQDITIPCLRCHEHAIDIEMCIVFFHLRVVSQGDMVPLVQLPHLVFRPIL